jgi:nucleotide-binding universal stress UspA family protein
MTTSRAHDLLVGFDGSVGATGAIELGARLLPGRNARIVHLWSPRFAVSELHARVARRTGSVRELIGLLESEARAQAARVAADGVTLAQAAGWTAEPLLKQAHGGEGLELAALAEELDPEALILGSRGPSGVHAVLGSVSYQAAHASPVPVLVVPRRVLSSERDDVATAPVLVGDDGSVGAERAAAAAHDLFPERRLHRFHVSDATSGRAVADGLLHRARDLRAALIVVGSRGRPATQEILLGSGAMAVLHRADRPVMVVPARAGGSDDRAAA